ncbi:hypothetical protein [Desulfurobacterium atlanticum]|uniref:PH domain-containing protein n=1 Tax=Desulfurobacterium atlanticum TaxID=240169 RepID=A0A238YKU5_9BACT|nr:hypothetical protein [Desulfurobacterium atlanticum]SNR71876.1 hypothetical protein SAMN06265340_1045 [Desulfurobacterium atlanticum]
MKEFKTDKVYLLSYLVLSCLYVLFLAVVAFKYGINLNFFVLVLLMLPILIRVYSLIKKKIQISDNGIEIEDIFKSGFVRWSDIDSVGISMRRKIFLILSLKDGGAFLIDDNVEGFEDILKEIEKHVPKDRLPENWEEAVSSYKPSRSGIFLVLLAILVILYVVFKSFMG